jgi:hypothetical protein
MERTTWSRGRKSRHEEKPHSYFHPLKLLLLSSEGCLKSSACRDTLSRDSVALCKPTIRGRIPGVEAPETTSGSLTAVPGCWETPFLPGQVENR